jgi:hypothetical protein
MMAADMPQGYRPDGGLVPVPDPTLLTTQALLREVAALKELMEVRTDAIISLYDEKFTGVSDQFIERDKAVQAAFVAQKETAIKSENSMLESQRQLRDLFDANSRSMNDKINGLKERLDRGEGVHTGGKDVWGYVVGAIGTMLSIGTLVVLLITRVH